MDSRGSRVARGWIAGSFATGIAALSHGVVAGGAPSPFAIGVGLVFSGLLGTFAIGRSPSLPRLAAVVLGSQFAFHLVFSELTPATSAGAAAGSGHHGAAMLLAPTPAAPGADASMWVAHGFAMLATLVFLRRAELAVFELVRDAVLECVEITRRLTLTVVRPTALGTSTTTEPPHPVASFLRFVVSHRGPPVAALARRHPRTLERRT